MQNKRKQNKYSKNKNKILRAETADRKLDLQCFQILEFSGSNHKCCIFDIFKVISFESIKNVLLNKRPQKFIK